MININASKQDLELINKYTISPVNAEDVFCFSVILCDNQIDRDFERFDNQALYQMKELFLGKTGIFDHAHSAFNQAARIYYTEVISDKNKNTSTGEIYFALKAKAYMLNIPENISLIKEIKAGIKKEVSVGCSINMAVCSVCGKNIIKDKCSHKKGKINNGIPNHVVLKEVTDAYEWSFVAVPAQASAGVTKSYKKYIDIKNNYESGKDLEENLNILDSNITKNVGQWNQSEQNQILDYIKSLEKYSEYGKLYHDQLVKQVVKQGFFKYSNVNSSTLENIAKKLDVSELLELKKAFFNQDENIMPQTSLSEDLNKNIDQKNQDFKI